MSPYISLNMDTFAIVDTDDYEKVKSYNWFLSGTGYAVAFVPADGKFKLTYLHRSSWRPSRAVRGPHQRLFAGQPAETCGWRRHARTDRTGASARCLRQG